MDQQLIVQTLKSACGNKSFRFQVIIQNAKLHIYINHKAKTHPGRSFLTKLVVQAIAPLSLTEYEGAWLYSRQLGETKPSWQTYIEFPLELGVNEMNTIGNSDNLPTENKTQSPGDTGVDSITDAGFFSQAFNDEPVSNFSELNDDSDSIEALYGDFDLAEFEAEDSCGDTGLLNNSGMIHKAALHEEEIDTFVNLDDDSESIEALYSDFELVEFEAEDSCGDTGLLNDTGMIHKAALHEEEIDTFVKLVGDNSLGFDIAEQDQSNSDAEDSDHNSLQLNLAQYCFVSNKKMLTGDIISPDKETIRLVKIFHHFSDNNKAKILPILDDYFRLAKIPDTENLSFTVQKWFKQITELDDDHRYKAEIWLSRYCFDSTVTLEEFRLETAKREEIAKDKKNNAQSKYDLSSTNFVKEINFTSNINTELKPNRFNLLSIIQKSVLPVVWTAATIGIIFLGINTNNSLVGSQNNFSLCENTIGSQAYCRLGVNLVGEQKIRQLTPDAVPLTEIQEKEAKLGCQRYANFKANIADEDLLKTPVLSSYGNKVFPHVFVVEASQKNINNDQEVKVGCVYITGNAERAPLTVNAEVIADDFSQETSQTQPKKSNISFGSYTNAINLGLYTIFTAIGLVIVSKLRLGIEIRKLQTIYLVALAVAILQSFVGVNFLAGILLPVITMITMSIILKDFKLKRNFGYLLTMIGIFTVVAIQFLLYGLFQILINSLV